ncbi:hypothetical protein PRIPAC_73469, partial [Pristionchus pacificus]
PEYGIWSSSTSVMQRSSPRTIKGGATVARRWLSMQEANAALRPFYFAVHPDRFASMPDVRDRNEKALKIFNGYLNDLFPRPMLSSSKPIQVVFSIKDKAAGTLRDVNISLQGNDPVHIVRHALESCKLSTAHFKATPKPPAGNAGMAATGSTSSMSMNEAASFYWGEYMKRREGTQDTASILKKRREEAIEKTKQAETFRLTLKDEIEDLKWRTGCAAVVWQMEWAESHMRRCLTTLHRLLDNASKEDRDTMVTILLKNTIRFGRGSFICCDGGVQFGADQVPEQWQKVCSEAAVRRQLLAQLRDTKKNLAELMGGAEIICPGARGLGQTLQQLQTLTMRISSRELAMRRRVLASGQDLMIEVATAYDELAVGQDGRLRVPCNVDVAALAAFLEEKGKMSNVQRGCGGTGGVPGGEGEDVKTRERRSARGAVPAEKGQGADGVHAAPVRPRLGRLPAAPRGVGRGAATGEGAREDDGQSERAVCQVLR